MSIKTELLTSFKKGDTAIKLIYFNLAVYLLIKLIHIVCQLMLVDDSLLIDYLAVPSSLEILIYRPWTIISYMFIHTGFIHILFNVLNLYWFGRIFLMYFNQKQLVGVYVLGGIVGAMLFIISYNVFPYFQEVAPYGTLIGASAGVMSIIMGVALYQPNMYIQLALIGKVKLKYIAAVLFLISFFSIAGKNAGGNIAHLGGVLVGYLFVISIKRGKDLTRRINQIIDFFVDLFTRKTKMKVTPGNRPVSDASWNENKKKENELIDSILDKIKKTGYESLSSEEKKKLFEQGSKK